MRCCDLPRPRPALRFADEEDAARHLQGAVGVELDRRAVALAALWIVGAALPIAARVDEAAEDGETEDRPAAQARIGIVDVGRRRGAARVGNLGDGAAERAAAGPDPDE